jgi:hypothetical protein
VADATSTATNQEEAARQAGNIKKEFEMSRQIQTADITNVDLLHAATERLLGRPQVRKAWR